MLRHLARAALLWIHRHAVRVQLNGDPTRPAVVFSPHFDDETLGCGGSIILKRRAGAEVVVVFMTDGSRSHANLMPAAELARLRQAEGREACNAMGIDASSVKMLLYPEGSLALHAEDATRRVAEMLKVVRPEEIYLPYRGDVNSDHVATNSIVLSAADRVGRPFILLEYPVWFWKRWPWMMLPASGRRLRLRMLEQSIRSGFGLPELLRFRRWVPIAGVLQEKLSALRCYRTQTTRLREGWPILSDVSSGEWLELFFRPYEIFRQTTASGAAITG